MHLTPREQEKLLVVNAPDLISFGTSGSSAQKLYVVAEMINEAQVEATFPDGTKLVTVHHPIR